MPPFLAAEALLTELAPAFMVNHSLRTYWFSRLLGLASGQHADDEALYVASLLHDAGFYGRYATATPESECISIRGARAAYDILGRCGWEMQRQDRVAEAITLHVNGDVPLSHGSEAFLLERGVMLDITGLHAWSLHPETVQGVFARHPRPTAQAHRPALRTIRPDSRTPHETNPAQVPAGGNPTSKRLRG
jgi:hypothetical protein